MEFQSKGMATGGRKLEEMAQMVAQMEEDGVADEHMKAMWAGQSNVLVAVRVRPLLKHDVIKKSIVRVLDAKVVIIMDPSHDKNDVLRGNRSREKQYAFDYVFEPGSSQQSVYNHTSKFLIHGVLDGFNATVFAYGNTGAGKTHTMIGSPSEPGIMLRIMNDLFHYCHKAGQVQRSGFKITVSFLEVYNENIKDLLSETQEYLDLREDPIAGPVVSGILEIEAKNSDEIMNLLQTGNQRRTQQPTAANEVSSRSHAVFQVVVECKDRAPGTVANIKVGKLSLVDLAGSERAANTKNSGKRLVEGANINRSLLALGNCINALGEKGNKGNFVPYRDSKLTRLLKDSLGGNCRTVMIANISSAESCFEETLNTLKYANRAKNIKTNVQRNVLNVNHHISEYVNLIANLRAEIKILKDQISTAPTSPGPVSGMPGQLLIPPLSPSHRGGAAGGGAGGAGVGVPPLHPAVSVSSPLQVLRQPSTPLQSLRDSMRSATTSLRATTGEGREVLNLMRQKIVDNFQERMQLRRSLIELEDQNVQNSIEVSKRQMILVNWSGDSHHTGASGAPINAADTLQLQGTDLATEVLAHGTPEIKEALSECEQLRKAISKNNAMKKNIEKRLRNNEKDAESFRSELSNKITGEDRRELMELQYQVGRLELENMELEQHRIVHESILKGKDLTIQKLKLQLAVKDKIIKRQKLVLSENGLARVVGYEQLAAMERALMDADSPTSPPSPPRQLRKKSSATTHNSANGSSGPQEEVDQISTAYSNPPSARDLDPPLGHGQGGGGDWHHKIPPISQVKSSSDPNRIHKVLLGAEGGGGGGGSNGKKIPSPLKHQHPQQQQQHPQQGVHLHSEYDDSYGGDFELEESEDFHRKPRPQQQQLHGQQMSRKPKAPALIFPSDSHSHVPTSVPVPVPVVKGIRQGGLLSQLGGPVGGAGAGHKVSRVASSKGIGLGAAGVGGRGLIQNEERWMEGGAGAGAAAVSVSEGDSASNNSKYQPTTPRGQKSHQRGSYETKFDRDRRSHPNTQHHQQSHPHSNHGQHQLPYPLLSSQSDDGLEVLDDISESYDDHHHHLSSAAAAAVMRGRGGGGGGGDDDDQSIMSDISLEKVQAGGGGGGSPGQGAGGGGGVRTRQKKQQQKNSVLGKLNKKSNISLGNGNGRMIDPIEESYGSSNGGPTPSPSVSDLQIGPSQVPPGMMIPAQQQQQQSQQQQHSQQQQGQQHPRSVRREVKGGVPRTQGKPRGAEQFSAAGAPPNIRGRAAGQFAKPSPDLPNLNR